MCRELKFRGWNGRGTMIYSSEGSMEAFWAFADNTYGDGPPVMQYTGIKDKNGADIYEGDILQGGALGQPPLLVVEYKIKDVHQRTQEGPYTSIRAGFEIDGYWGDPKQCVVIGNIYQNPELAPITL